MKSISKKAFLPLLLLIPLNFLVVLTGYINLKSNARTLQDSLDNYLTLITYEIQKDITEIEDYIYLNIESSSSFLNLFNDQNKDIRDKEFYLDSIKTLNTMENTVSSISALKSIFFTIDKTGYLYQRGTISDTTEECFKNGTKENLFWDVDSEENPAVLYFIKHLNSGSIGYEINLQPYIEQIYNENIAPYEIRIESKEAYAQNAHTEPTQDFIVEKGIGSSGLVLICHYEKNAVNTNISRIAYIIAILSFLSVLITPILFRFYQKMQRDMYEMQLRQKELQLTYYSRQIRPHFILNVLNMIYSYQKTEWDTARETIMNLVQYFRYVVNVKKEFVQLQEEMNFTKNYLEIQKKRLEGQFMYMITWEHSLDTVPIPPLVIMTFVENSMKHGLQSGRMNCIAITVSRKENALFIQVLDSGPGFSEEILEAIRRYQSNKATASCLGTGLINTLERLEMYYGTACKVNFNNEGGGNVEISIPLER